MTATPAESTSEMMGLMHLGMRHTCGSIYKWETSHRKNQPLIWHDMWRTEKKFVQLLGTINFHLVKPNVNLGTLGGTWDTLGPGWAVIGILVMETSTTGFSVVMDNPGNWR